MRNNQEFIKELSLVVGRKRVIVDAAKTKSYRTGIRLGTGSALAVVIPNNLLEFWDILKLCVSSEKAIIIQAANTGLTGGSTPNGDDYGRDVIIINTLNLSQIILLQGGKQIIAFPGATLYQLEKKLSKIGRSPHSVIGSSCIGASIVGGICNNSGGNLVNRGPSFTQYSLYAKLNRNGELVLINNLGLNLGSISEEILNNLTNFKFCSQTICESSRLASDTEYKHRVRDVNSSEPARYNSDIRRLYDASGCAGKIAVFAVRLDTFIKPENEKVFYIGTNNPEVLNKIRYKILNDFKELPDMGEYMHSSYFDGSDMYCKEIFLILKYFGTAFLPMLFRLKYIVNNLFSVFPFGTFKENFSDKALHYLAQILPDHLPKRLRTFRNNYEHHMLILSSDSVIDETRKYLNDFSFNDFNFEYFECDQQEASAALLHRYVAGNAPAKHIMINPDSSGELLPLDIALPRNCCNWHDIFPVEITSKIAASYKLGHFLCMVFHWDFVLKKGVDLDQIKSDILRILDNHGAKYPAEHNVGHLYFAEYSLENFYRKLDPTNTFNPGVGKMSKKKNYL